MIYYTNHNEAGLPIEDKLKALGVGFATIPIKKCADGILGIVHDTDLRAKILDHGKKPLWLRNNGIVLVVSSEGVKYKPERRFIRTCKRYCYVFGITKTTRKVLGVTQFLDREEWREIIEWAKASAKKYSVEDLKESASEVVKKLLWPDDDDRRSKMALAVLCQGFLFCFCQNAANKDWGEDVVKALKIMECTGGQKASAERRKEISGMWESVQLAEWWLRVFRAGNGGDALKKSERANGIVVIKELLGKETKFSRDSTKLATMLENGKVNDANVVARVFIRLEKELA